MSTDIAVSRYDSWGRVKQFFLGIKEAIMRLLRDVVFYWPWRLLVLFMRLIYGFRAHGMEKLPRDGPFILILSEFSVIATIISGWISVLQVVRIHSLKPNAMISYMQEELWRFGFFRNVATNRRSRGHYAPLEPHSAGRLALALMDGYRILRDGGIVIMNPEGDMPWDGRPLPTGLAVSWLGLHSGAPIVPAVVSVGSYDVWPRWQAGPSLRGRMKMTVGEPFTLCDKPKARVTREEMEAAAERVRAVFDEIRYGPEGLSGWAGPALRNGQPVAELPVLPVISPPPPVAPTTRPPTPVRKRGMAQLLWRCPICHAEDALEHHHSALRSQTLHCRACDTTWAVSRHMGRDFRLSVISGPKEVMGLEMALSAWYDAMKKDLRPVARDLSGVDLLPGEEAYLAVDGVSLMPHCPSSLLDGWTGLEPPMAQPRGAAQLGEWGNIGSGRLVLTNQRLHWQGSERQVDCYWSKVMAAFLWELNTLGIHYGSAPYRFPLDGEVGMKWLTYAGTMTRQAAERSGTKVTTSPF